MLPFPLSALHRRIWHSIRDLILHNQWILLLGAGDPLSGALSAFARIVPPQDRSWADPFVIHRDGVHYIFIEEVPRQTRKGHISVIQVDGDLHCSAPLKIIERPYHLSYPFLFAWQGDLYMIPESGANRTIDAYRCVEFPHRWTFHKTLMRDVRAVDATLLNHQGRWWLFTSIAVDPTASTRDTLFLFSGTDPLTDTWTPHPRNPVVSDLRRARPAGRIFARDGHLYRPSQDCSKRYGYALRINRITRLTETEYAEEEVRLIEPDSDLTAVHTLNHDAGLTALDGKRRRWMWSSMGAWKMGDGR